MKICVYGASSNTIDDIYIKTSEELGREIAKRGHTLVFGCGASGVMGGCARGAKEENGEIIGITPTFFNVDGMLFEECTQVVRTETMRERKKLLEEMSDAYIIAPGGIGTFDEFFEILTLKQLSRHTKAIVIYNVNHYYDELLAFLAKTVKEEFLRDETLEIYEIFSNVDDIMDYLENYKPVDRNILNLKNI